MSRFSRGAFSIGVVASTATVLILSAVSFADELKGPILKAMPADPQAVQLAVEKGLFFVEQQSMRWWKTDKCATCHEGGILLVAANVAKSQGVPVDQEKLDFWTDRWVLVDGISRKSKKGEIVGLGMWTAPLMYLHRDAAREESKSRAAMWTTVIRGSVALQDKDGLWPGSDVDVTPRMALALASLEVSKIPFPADFRGELAERRGRAEAWIKSHDPQRPEKTESLAAWIAYELERGEPARAKQLLDELQSRRNADGGWGIKRGDPSHTLVTAVVLFALKSGGVPNDDPLVISLQRYLLDRQKEDGRWQELGRHFAKDKNTPSNDAWTSGYAVAALSLTLPKLPTGTQRLFVPDPALVAEVDQLAKSAAEGYVGEGDRTGDPTQVEDEEYKEFDNKSNQNSQNGKDTPPPAADVKDKIQQLNTQPPSVESRVAKYERQFQRQLEAQRVSGGAATLNEKVRQLLSRLKQQYPDGRSVEFRKEALRGLITIQRELEEEPNVVSRVSEYEREFQRQHKAQEGR